VWTIQVRDDQASPPVWRNVPDIVLHAVDRAKIQVPAGTEFAFLGSPGAEVWLLPQVQQSGILWPGWNTQDPSVVSGVRTPVVWTLRGVDGPGTFVLFLTGSFGRPEVLFNSTQALPQQMNIPPNTHAHGNWAFTKPGVYRLSVQMSATTTGGQPVSDTRTLSIAVGALPLRSRRVDPGRRAGPAGHAEAPNSLTGGCSQTRCHWVWFPLSQRRPAFCSCRHAGHLSE
jgi:putative ABC transporter-associated repeat protein